MLQAPLPQLPEPATSFLENGGWLVILGVATIFGILAAGLVVVALLRKRGAAARNKRDRATDLAIDLDAIAPAEWESGNKHLRVEGLSVRLRLVVLASVGRGQVLSASMASGILDRVVPGLGDMVIDDRPVIHVWPVQLSHEGFANLFHRNTPLPEGEDEPSCWILMAGRAQVGAQPILIGLGVQSSKPTTVGRKRLEAHQWASVLRIRIRAS